MLPSTVALVGLVACEPGPRGADEREEPAVAQAATDARTHARAGSAGADLSIAERLEVYRLAADADQPAIAALLESTLGQAGSPKRDLTIELLVERLSELDPVAAAEAVSRQGIGLEREPMLEIFSEAVRMNPQAALAALHELAATEASNDVSQLASLVLVELRHDARLLGRWLDVVDALQATDAKDRASLNAMGNPSMRYTRDLYRAGIAALAGLDMEAALQRILTLDPSFRTQALLPASAVWGNTEPERALALARSIADPALRAELRRAIFSAWAQEDPLAAMRFAATGMESDDGVNDALVAGFSKGVADALASGAAPADLIALAEQLPDSLAARLHSFSIAAVARQDPMAAAAMLDSLPGNQRRSAYDAVADFMVRVDPATALEWVIGQPYPGLEEQVLSDMAESNPDLALQLALGNSLRMPADALSGVASTIIDEHPERAAGVARRLTESLPQSSLYQSVIGEFVKDWMSEDAEAALDWTAAEGSRLTMTAWDDILERAAARPELAAAYAPRLPAEPRGELLRRAAFNLTNRDPEAALVWVQQFRGDGDAYVDGMTGVIQQLVYSDVGRGARLLAEMPQYADVRATLHAAEAFATRWADVNPRAAADWAAGIDKLEMRQAAMVQVARAWSPKDSEAARNWMLRSPGGPSRDEALLEHLDFIVREGLPVSGDIMGAFSSAQARSRAERIIAEVEGVGD